MLDLTGYDVQMFFNGSTSAGLTISLVGTVADGDVFVLANGNAVQAILDVADQTNSSGWFNGDDAVILRNNSVVIDAFGEVGTDPGSEWPGGGQNDTLRRNSNICTGDTVPNDAFDASIEWAVFSQDTFDDLGQHTADCGGGPADPVINEFVANHTGADTNAFVEVFGSPSTDYSGFTVLEIEGDGSSTGVIDAVLPVGVTDAGGYWTDPEDMENGTLTILLVEGFSGNQGDDLDTNNDGVIDVSPWTRVVDDVAVSDGGGSDITYSSTVLAPFFDGDPFRAGGASRIPQRHRYRYHCRLGAQ